MPDSRRTRGGTPSGLRCDPRACRHPTAADTRHMTTISMTPYRRLPRSSGLPGPPERTGLFEGDASPEEVVVAYHERTKHHFHRFAAAFGYMDWTTQPDPFRRYAGAPVVRLPLPRAGRRFPTAFRYCQHDVGHALARGRRRYPVRQMPPRPARDGAQAARGRGRGERQPRVAQPARRARRGARRDRPLPAPGALHRQRGHGSLRGLPRLSRGERAPLAFEVRPRWPLEDLPSG